MAEQTLAIIASMMQQAAHDATLYCAEAIYTLLALLQLHAPRYISMYVAACT
jgi:hypothetical protein